MNWLDRLISSFAPVHALTRYRARRAMAAYEAAEPTTLRKARRERGDGDTAVIRAGTRLREQARHLEQNHDLAGNVLNVLVQNVVGPNGIQIEPQPRRLDGSIDDAFAGTIERLLRDWGRRPDVTWQHTWSSLQRIAARSWFRDGEVFAQLLQGISSRLDHGTRVPFSLELLESDFVPFDKEAADPDITAGIERNAWGRPVAYHVLHKHPGGYKTGYQFASETKRVTADRMLHLAMRTRIKQARGVSVFASVLSRFEDIKDYEESERIAAKIAASMAAYISKGSPDEYTSETDENGNPVPRDLQFRPGMIFDDLRPGESIGTIDTSRPNTSLEAHRNGQLRAAAAGTGVSYSSLSKNYDGTYSAQRQELVESYGAYGVLSDEFIGRFVQPTYEQIILTAVGYGVLQVPDGIDLGTITAALYVPPQMPWIDPVKEANAWEVLESRNYASGPEIVRKRGQNPRDVLDQQQRWQQMLADRGLTSSNAPIRQVDPAEPTPITNTGGRAHG